MAVPIGAFVAVSCVHRLSSKEEARSIGPCDCDDNIYLWKAIAFDIVVFIASFLGGISCLSQGIYPAAYWGLGISAAIGALYVLQSVAAIYYCNR